ncbi:MAG: CoA-binding protein [Candidatus Micrarchaeota archaeon]
MAQTIAVIGASADRAKFGNKCVRAYAKRGYTVFPVNPKEAQTEGRECYPSITDVPGHVDIVSVYLPPRIGIGLLEDIAAKKPGMVYFNPGAGSEEIREEAARLSLKTVFGCSIRAIGEDPADY